LALGIGGQRWVGGSGGNDRPLDEWLHLLPRHHLLVEETRPRGERPGGGWSTAGRYGFQREEEVKRVGQNEKNKMDLSF